MEYLDRENGGDLPNAQTSEPLHSGIIIGGIVSGVAAGVAAALAFMIQSYYLGLGFWLPLNLYASMIFGVEALVGGAGVVIAGLVLHLAFAAIYGIIFSVLCSKRGNQLVLLLEGMAYALILWFTSVLMMPAVNPVLADRIALMRSNYFWSFVFFGLFLSLTPKMITAFAFTPRESSRGAFKRPASSMP